MAIRPTKTATKKTTTTKVAPATAKIVAKTSTTTMKAVATPKAMVVETVQPVIAGLPIKKPELIDRVVTETGMKKKDVKPVVEAMLAVLARTLSAGEEITAPPMGKLMIKRVKDMHNAKVMTLKLRIPIGDKMGGSGPNKDPLAEVAE